MKKNKYRLFNKTYQVILLKDGNRILPRSYLFVNLLTTQIQNLINKELLNVKKF